MRRTSIVEILNPHGYQESFSSPYVFYHSGRSHFASMGRPKFIKNRSEDQCWIVNIWVKGDYNIVSYYDYDSFIARLESGPPLIRIKSNVG